MFRKYPWVFCGKDEPITQNLIGAFGLEIGLGWYNLVEILASTYEHSMKRNWDHYPMVKFTQIKEKFGGLRAYIHCQAMNEEQYRQRWLADEERQRNSWKKGDKSKWEEYDPKKYTEYLKRAANGAITFQAWESMAEDISFHICEDCGTMDDVTTGGQGWISTLCTHCRKTRESQEAWWRWRNLSWNIKYYWKYTLQDKIRNYCKRKEKPKDEKNTAGEPPPCDKQGG